MALLRSHGWEKKKAKVFLKKFLLTEGKRTKYPNFH